MKHLCVVIAILVLSFGGNAQDVWLHPNAGQWDDRVEYKVELDLGEMLIEKDKFTYHLTDLKLHGQHDDHEHSHADHEDEPIRFHVIQSTFLNSSWQGQVTKEIQSSHYRNYILGNDPSKWQSKLYSYQKVTMHDYYPGIDMILSGANEQLKYSFRLQPGVDSDIIEMVYVGQDKLTIAEDGSLHIANRFGEIIEGTPEAWLEESGANVEIEFQLSGDTVRFILPNGYDSNETLIIDPTLVFSSYTGASADNWGMTATPDSQGALFAGGIIFGLGYPITPGAFQTGNNSQGTVQDRYTDVGITKFTSDGSSLLYSTYLGGIGSETANSIVANANDELFIFGVTSSINFPMAGTPYDASYGGGPNVPTSATNLLNFTDGQDLYVARLSADGTTLQASTYMGGSNTDGLNIIAALRKNLGDQFRGEIILDDQENVIVSSTTRSTNFPTQMGSQSALSGVQDAVVFKMTPTLNNLIWSTYFGGSGEETGNSVQLSSNGTVYMAGGTTSANLPISGGYDMSFGGDVDGYVARFNGNNGTLQSGTYIGENEYDQVYFVQLDVDDRVYVLGQTDSNLGISGVTYGNANSGQFIQKYASNLSTQEWRTMVGAGTGQVEISPTAFLVSDCYDIYFSGWGGALNINNGNAPGSTTNGFPVTPNAYQTTTNGNNFYIGVLGPNANSLKYGTFFGGTANISDEHVDGGTSRFDKSGRIYHAVCGGCGGNSNGFTTTPGAWSPANGSSNCNLAAFKFELNQIDALISVPNTTICIPNPAVFSNNSANGNTFYWDFGDGNTSTDVNPSHLYSNPGTYNVTLVVTDSNQCYSPDTVELVLNIGDFGGGIVPLPGPICPGDSVQLEAFGGADYLWSPAQFMDNPNIATPTISIMQDQTFQVIISDSCGIDTAYIDVEVVSPSGAISNDTTICIGNSVQLQASGGISYQWSPPTFLNDDTSPTPVSTPTSDILYTVEITTAEGCLLTENVLVEVEFTPPTPVIPDEVTVCAGASTTISVSGASSYSWYPNVNITGENTNTVTITPSQSMYYYCIFSNACDDLVDSVYVNVTTAEINAFNDTIICPGETAILWAEGGVSYGWTPANSLNNANLSSVLATPSEPTMYTVAGTDINGCVDYDSVYVDFYPAPFIQTSPDVHAFIGDQVQLSATSSTVGPYEWSPSEFLTCVNCPNPIANPDQNFTYTVQYTDQNGCTAADTVAIFYDPLVYVPNTFTPGGEDNVNPVFQAYGGNVKTFEMLIFNRWGEVIHTIENFNDSWDGTYKGAECQDGTYVWKATFTDFTDKEYSLEGHVNLLR
ncbi:MAG: PKD domain-containing protein [bacterium]|nr:PKD domain-containing protein [bacterium]